MGSAVGPSSHKCRSRISGPFRLAQQLALGVWIERQVEAGRVGSYAEMARVLDVSRARVTQLVDLGLRAVEEREGWLCGKSQ